MSTRPYFDAVTRQTGAAGAAGSLPVSRYVLPQFEERTAYGFKRQDPYAKLFEDRIVFMGVQVDDASPTTSWLSSWSWSPRTQTASSPCTSTAPADPSRR